MRGPLEMLAKRYIAGTERSDAIEVARRLNSSGIGAIIDNLGENVTDESQARASVDEYRGLLKDIREAGVDSTVSMKLTHLGLDISTALAQENAASIIEEARRLENFVRIDMEGSTYTQRTLDVFLALRERHSNVGVAVQSYLRRSLSDIKHLNSKDASVRLVKGAYREPSSVAFPEKKEVDANFSLIMRELLLNGTRPAIATHDERLIDEARGIAADNGIERTAFDFEFLLGIKRTLQKTLSDEGYSVRVYIPYGVNWLPYTLRRLRERKENVLFVLRNIFD